MTRSYKIWIEAQAAVDKLKNSANAVLVGFEEGSDAVIVGAATIPSDQISDFSSILPPPLKVIGSTSSLASPQALSQNPLQSSKALVRCAVDFVLQVPQSGSVDGVLAEWEDALCGPDTVSLVNDSEIASNQSIQSLGGTSSSPVVLKPFLRRTASLSAPTASVQPAPEQVQWSTVHLDALCYVSPSTTAEEAVQKYLNPALKAQFRACSKELGATANGSLVPLRALHFLPAGLGHHVTLVYPLSTPCIEADEAALQPRRAALHAVLGLPHDRPLLRVANAVDPGNVLGLEQQTQKTSSSQQTRLKNVHQGLPGSGVKGGTQHLVRGEYDYYHYMQDKFDDSGWGCAYRSLQTLCSWFQRQHYTSRAPPMHREIQSTLAALGDKPVDFVGSKQWIGAIELGFILDTLLGVSSKVITVSSGDEMPTKARDIAAHFDTQGTPIMIGGGVLAYTLLGIDHNPDSGECAFLILDPHYTGTDDMGKIRSGQWVAWKRLGDKAAAGGELFVPGAFYNLLCPQRPNTV